MEVQKKRRSICKADSCLLPNEESQELLARNHIRFLSSLMTRKCQLCAYLQLVDMHLENDTIPPGLRIDITPPGYSWTSCDDSFSDWNMKTRQCSKDLLHLLQKKYIHDLRRLERLVQYSTSQLTIIVGSLNGVGRQSARLEVSEIVNGLVEESNKTLLKKFDEASCCTDEEKFLEQAKDFASKSSSRKEFGVTEEKDVIEEQTRSFRRLSLDSKKTYDNIYPERKTFDEYGLRNGETKDNVFGTSTFDRRFSRNETFSTYTKSRIDAEEEEMKYLEFINSVTNDILTRGVYSDRVLAQVMERHLIQNKGRLDETRMKHMLMKLKQDLGVSSSPPTDHFQDQPVFSARSKHHVPSDRQRLTLDSKERSYSSISLDKESYSKPPTKDSTWADGDVPTPKKRGILKAGGASSGSDVDRRSALSSGDEKFKEKDFQKLDHLDPKQPNSLSSTMQSDVEAKELLKVYDPSGRRSISERSSSLDKGLNEAVSVRSISDHSLGSLHSDYKTSIRDSDPDDF